MRDYTVDYQATEKQEEFLHAEKQCVLGSGGYGGGKSEILAISTVKYSLLNPGLSGMVVADTFGRLERDFLPKVERVLQRSGIDYIDLGSKAARELTGEKGGGTAKVKGWLIAPGDYNHKLLFGSLNEPKSLKGPTLSHIHGEEMTTFRGDIKGAEEPTFNVLHSRLRAMRPDGGPASNVLRGTGTPESIANWTMRPGMFWRPPVLHSQRDAWARDFGIVTMSTWDSERAGFLPAGFTQSMIDKMTPDQVAEKIDGIPKAGGAGRAYPEFLYERNVAPVQFDRFLGDVLVGLDFNVNPMTCTLMQNNRGILQVFAEIWLPHSNTEKMARAILDWGVKNKVPPHHFRVFPDATGRSRRTSGPSDHKVLRNAGLRRLTFPKESNPPVSTRLNTVNAALYHRRAIFDPSLVHTIEDFEQTAKTDEGDLVKGPNRTHCTDGFGYVAIHEVPLRADTGGLLAA